MTKSTTGRHRADLPVSTPLTGVTETLSSALATPVSAAGKGSLVVAVSSGLVAGVGLPASATLQSAPEAKTPTAAVPQLGSADATSATANVAASAGAQVAFEHEAFRPVAKHVAATTSAAQASREVSAVSRSLARAAYSRLAHQAHVRAAAHRAQVLAASQTHARAVAAHRASVQAAARPAHAAPVVHHSSSAARPAPVPKSTSSVVAIASRYLGVPYLYGGSSPRGFDCSGFTKYVYGLLGVSLPRTAAQQYSATTHVSRSSARPGDLVFFFTGGSVTHVGIYLGGNMMIAAPHTGDVVKRQTIYSANVAFGRV